MFEQIKDELRAAEERAKRFWKDPKGVLRRRLRKTKPPRRTAEERAERRERKKKKLRVAKEQRAERLEHKKRKEAAGEETRTGALPDFVIIGGRKCGTTFLYHLLTLHPFVERALKKEPHFFDLLFDEGAEWYRQYFPSPKQKDGRRTITGEATPLMAKSRTPERMAQVIPQARLIALLRNPVDRAYSDYQMLARKGWETRSFEEAIGFEGTSLDDKSQYLSRSLYFDQLQRWHKYFSEEQMLVLKSEDFFERPLETLKVVLDFLELPEWEPEASELPKRQNKGSYERGMDPETRRRLEEYFEPHNQRLYDYLGVDFGW